MSWALLEGLAPDDVRVLLSIARRRRFDRGEVVVHQDDPADALHLIGSGRFAFSIMTPRGDTVLLGIRGPGASFGELALLGDGRRRAATVTALEPAETRSISTAEFDRLREQHPGINQVLIASLAQEIRDLDRRLLEALFLPVERRVLRRLVELADIYPDGVVPLTQEQLAEFAGASRATVNRILREEEVKHTVELRRGRTIIRDRDAIAKRAR